MTGRPCELAATASGPVREGALEVGAQAAFVAALRRELAYVMAGAEERAVTLALAPDAKRVRPRLLFELATALGVPPDSGALLRCAAAVELIHTASLVHDDVIDMAASRRGLPSVNAGLGNAAAVLVGDELLCRALKLVGDVADGALLPPCIDAVAAMTRGALREIAACGDLGLDDDQWREIAAGKTGALFALCGTLAALLAGDTQRALRFAEATRALGVAFQAADDVADLKSGGDLDDKNPNLAVLCATRAQPALRERLLSGWARPRLAAEERCELVRGVLAARGASAAIAVAQHALAQARACFDQDSDRAGVGRALAAGQGYLARAQERT